MHLRRPRHRAPHTGTRALAYRALAAQLGTGPACYPLNQRLEAAREADVARPTLGVAKAVRFLAQK